MATMVIGGRPEEKALKRLAAELGLSDHIFPSGMHGATYPPGGADADIGLLPVLVMRIQ